MALLKEDGSLDIERINKLPLEEHMKEIGSFTREQFKQYVSTIPLNEGKSYPRAVMVDTPHGVDAKEFMNKMREKYGMKKELKYELSRIEGQIKQTFNAKDDYEQYCMVRSLGAKEKELLRFLLQRRKVILNELMICSPSEIARLKEINEQLLSLTNKLGDKTYGLYNALLQTGYDPEFDDDIMIEGTLRFVVDSWECFESVLEMDEDKEYESDFLFMMGMIYNLDGDNHSYPCARHVFSYDPKHTPDMTMEQLHLNNTLDDGTSWDHAGRFKDICVCHAIYSLTSDNLFSYPDVLRMNDFRCEVKVTHQFLADSEGGRCSTIEHRLHRNDRNEI